MSIEGLVTTAVDALRQLAAAGGQVTGLSDEAFLALARQSAVIRRLSDAHTAVIAGETARRSTRDLGHSGLAQRLGYRTPQELVKIITGSTATEALSAVRVGSLDPVSPVAAAVGATLSIAGADAITRGLGEPSGDITAEILAAAAAALIADAGTLDADLLYHRAREARDDLDIAEVPNREALLHSKRSLVFVKKPDGMSRLVWTMDPETAAHVGDLFDRATSPRLGGPRFVTGDRADLAAKIAEDPRTINQLASDVFLDLLRTGADADSSHLLGSGAPVVRIIVDHRDLTTGTETGTETGTGSASGAAPIGSPTGIAFIEGQSAPVSIATVERTICTGGTQQAIFDQNLQPLDLGREQRLFSSKQKATLALRDGGCMIEDCPCPPAWTEAHHLNPWGKGGKTDIANAILLCRFHHLMLHNNGWQIRFRNNNYWLIPPPSIDPDQTPRLLRSKSRALQRTG